ncbi:hypothetical protein EZY14_002755 [Kordia sp. TARA_039_SRF]|nr:hypothetical protein EZY14_002755 [Kordia sp. TARA_039_SRF]
MIVEPLLAEHGLKTNHWYQATDYPFDATKKTITFRVLKKNLQPVGIDQGVNIDKNKLIIVKEKH